MIKISEDLLKYTNIQLEKNAIEPQFCDHLKKKGYVIFNYCHKINLKKRINQNFYENINIKFSLRRCCSTSCLTSQA